MRSRPSRRSTSAPSTFIATSQVPTPSPTSSSPLPVTGTGSCRRRPRRAAGRCRRRARRRAPCGPGRSRATSGPLAGRPTTEPADRHSSSSPSRVVPGRAASRTAGSRRHPGGEHQPVEAEGDGDGDAGPLDGAGRGQRRCCHPLTRVGAAPLLRSPAAALLTSPRSFLPASRRSLLPRVGRVGRRGGGGGASASRSSWASRDAASSRFCSWLRSSCADHRQHAVDEPSGEPLQRPRPLVLVERRRAGDVERQLGAAVGGVHRLPARAGRAGEAPRQLGLGQRRPVR